MLTYACWASGRCVGTIDAPGKDEACALALVMWGEFSTIRRTGDTPARLVYAAMGKDEVANSLGREAEIMFKIGREP